MRPNGEVAARAYMVLDMPKEVEVYSERELERQCGDNLSNFTYVNIHCRLSSNRRSIIITNGFRNEKTNYMFDDGDLETATIEFDLK